MKARLALLACVALALGVLVITALEIASPPPSLAVHYGQDRPTLGALLFLDLILFMAWLIAHCPPGGRERRWAKASFALALSIPVVWWSFNAMIWSELIALGDIDIPAFVNARWLGDLEQTQWSILAISVALVSCVALTVSMVLSNERQTAP